ncbi:Nramp family divalent metal transporter [Mitsuaria sp. GD03876]|uniref:Nramp family divalent metal transporter n=1 Tax=Mitsuaria sp. GD03876 TaxID=2975399 RepID=UPI00244A121D|nr:Nramp family divalent metal transporter [Mitsuaria sp. GD03876]MDH0864318.1 Nramp family divalent metal transporter [Mitsuaria sp. GD03876]
MKAPKHVQPPWWSKLGPGLITGAADDDPSGIATYSQAGAQFGYAVSWTILLTFPLMVGIQLASARIGRITGKGLTETFAKLCPRWLVVALVSLLVLANVINLGADLSAMGDAMHLAIGGPASAHVIAMALVSLLLQIWLPYERYVKLLKWLTLSLLAYVGVGFAAQADWALALKSLVLPTLRWDRDYATTLVAILGTTISPYLFFWQASQEAEEIRRIDADRPLAVAPEQAAAQFRRLRTDTLVGMGFSNTIAFFMIVATAAALHAHGIRDIETTAQAATALKPIAGEFAFVLFAAGIVGTGFLALPVLAGSAAYAVATLAGVRRGLDRPPQSARAFYAILSGAMLVGLAVSLAGINPIKALVWSAVVNAVISVPIMVAVMIAASHPKIVGELRMPPVWRVLGWLATAAMALATVAMAVLQTSGTS